MRMAISLTASTALHLFVILVFNGNSFVPSEKPNDLHGEKLIITLVPSTNKQVDKHTSKSQHGEYVEDPEILEMEREMQKELGIKPEPPVTDCTKRDPII